MRIDTQWAQRVTLLWWFKSLLWDISSSFSLANHFDLLVQESSFGVSQGLPSHSWASLSQIGFQQRGLWCLASTPLLTSSMRNFLVRNSPGHREWKNMWSLTFGPGRSQPPLTIVLLFSSCSTGAWEMNFQLFTLAANWVGTHLLLPSQEDITGGGRDSKELSRKMRKVVFSQNEVRKFQGNFEISELFQTQRKKLAHCKRGVWIYVGQGPDAEILGPPWFPHRDEWREQGGQCSTDLRTRRACDPNSEHFVGP